MWSNSSRTLARRNVLDSSISWHCDWAGCRVVSRDGVRKPLANVIRSWFVHGATPLLLGAGCGPINPQWSVLSASSGWAHCIGAGKVWSAFLQSCGKEWHSLFPFLWQETYLQWVVGIFTFFPAESYRFLVARDPRRDGSLPWLAEHCQCCFIPVLTPYSVQSQTFPCLSFSRCWIKVAVRLICLPGSSEECYSCGAHRSWNHSTELQGESSDTAVHHGIH